MSLNIVPKGYRVIVQPDPIEESYGEAKIVIVEDKRVAQAATITGTLVAIGNLAWKGYKEGDGKPWANVGDRVYYAQYSGKTITDPITEENYLIMNDEDVIAIIENKQ